MLEHCQNHGQIQINSKKAKYEHDLNICVKLETPFYCTFLMNSLLILKRT